MGHDHAVLAIEDEMTTLGELTQPGGNRVGLELEPAGQLPQVRHSSRLGEQAEHSHTQLFDIHRATVARPYLPLIVAGTIVHER